MCIYVYTVKNGQYLAYIIATYCREKINSENELMFKKTLFWRVDYASEHQILQVRWGFSKILCKTTFCFVASQINILIFILTMAKTILKNED